ncbi:type IV toxin-antitoxin system AbiEi family antitoxin domain-containing protein [Solwaraspora sp. WMMA2065]|uniref:type IV toxin-antitoxin system AbiEi family antitoxin domain-containing protein n=1 Tax=Solwaraspora sp. WMMA2065 TaxID=3015166 RepID=UPI00259BD87F|nr:type IV toxin-antitoxin system AbiEi family antitoxin domain-containing protein [Solwaraspora sp. WMMA2065]WJK33365.1 type IV toxin-antitoxin system AbiEi family antitoxin domain-containing protein [Solwaraspora sp. WMMA2065]
MNRTNSTALAGVASDQWGMISTAQAAHLGITAVRLASMARAGELDRLAHGVYRLAGTPPDPHDDLRAAWIALDPRRTAAERIAAGPTEIVSHRSAAELQRLGNLDADLLEFTTIVRRQTRRTDVLLRRGTFDDTDWTLVDGLPTTTPLRTLRDLAASRADRGHLAGAVRDAVTQHSVPLTDISAELAPFAGSYGAVAGNGESLVDILLAESGIPADALDLVERLARQIVQLSTAHNLDPLRAVLHQLNRQRPADVPRKPDEHR